MTQNEMKELLTEHLSRYRAWSYAQLAKQAVLESTKSGCLEHLEGTTSDGTSYQVEINAFWDGQADENIRVCADLTVEPQKRLLGFLPIYVSNASKSFVMRPDSQVVG